MDPNASERADLARRMTAERIRRFKGSRQAAYSTVGVNSATWSKAEDAQKVAERSLVVVVQGLWPETGGDWRAMNPPLDPGAGEVEDVVRESNLPPGIKEYALRLIAADREGEDADIDTKGVGA